MSWRRRACPSRRRCGTAGLAVAERWRVGPVGTTLYRDGELVGGVETPELAAEIVETMNRVGRLLDEVRETEWAGPGDALSATAATGRGASERSDPPKKIFPLAR